MKIPQCNGDKENQNSRLRNTICCVTENDQNISIFRPDPLSWIPRHHVHSYKNDMSWHLLRITQKLNLECWRIVVDTLLAQKSEFIFSLVYQLSSVYCESVLPFLSITDITYNHLEAIASIYSTNIMLYRPNYIPQYLRVRVHHLSLFMSSRETLKTLLVYSQPIECLYSLDFHFQLDSLRDLRHQEQIQGFFDLSRCIISFQDFDKPFNVQANIDLLNGDQQDYLVQFRQKFNSNQSKCMKSKLFVSLWCEFDNPCQVPENWWPNDSKNPIPIDDFLLLLIKVSTTHVSIVIIIYKQEYYCICQEDLNDCMDFIICEVTEDGQLIIPEIHKEAFDTFYKRKSLSSLALLGKNLLVY
ncbi:hypothetical protein A0J61_09798 [Choanephora cucurbitarum]|uniref:Uncharacterized protein n=1 Tax=Choanephora cucurbitarum TaxID=101091 RepID=A0A1C7MZ07_9FUNG|nr:hypothetical protein A0J61_09798 [Choanephora cucurbitarum]